jgi:tetratricopeptide (TPR) repeat protein
MISADLESTEMMLCCASCGIAGVKLKECTDCDLVKYCGDKCREKHREQHSEEYNKRKTLLYDKELFTQPDETHLGECPICFLPLPLDQTKRVFYSCCSELVCGGCVHANHKSNIVKTGSCPFCREPRPRKGEARKRLMKRVKANDPVALSQMGACYNMEGDYNAAFKCLIKGAELGNVDAHHNLGVMYERGQGVEKDEEKAVYYYEKAAIGGHTFARYNLACIEEQNGNIERSVKHLIIDAKLGDEESMKILWKHYSAGNITKEDLDATLRTHQAAIDEMKSEQRNDAAKFFKQNQCSDDIALHFR